MPKSKIIKINTFKFVLLLLVISIIISCRSEKANNFLIQLDSIENKVFHIQASDSLENKRLEALTTRNPALAQSIADKQIQQLSSIISELKSTDVTDLPSGDKLKENTIQYYTVYVDLKKLDIAEAKLASTSFKVNANQAVNDVSNLAKQRMELYKVINRWDSLRHSAKLTFETSNDLQ